MQLVKAVVVQNKMVLQDVCLLEVRAPYLAERSEPGQFAQVHCGGGVYSLLRRPLSIHRVNGNSVFFLFQVKGEGTAWLAARKKDDPLDILGPLGRGFTLPDAGKVALAAGGMGLAPLHMLCQRAVEKGLEVTLILGARSSDNIPPVGELPGPGVDIITVTEDGSSGKKGLVTGALIEYLDAGRPVCVYSCGPVPMLAAVAGICGDRNIPAQVSLESRMACGLGVCRGCVVLTRRGGIETYENVCNVGPVFDAGEVVFDG